MSDRTSASLAKLEPLVALIQALPDDPAKARLIEESDALRRAIVAFHMEAIRFRMFNVERQLRGREQAAALQAAFEDLRHALEAAGFHTRSHTAP